MKRPSHAGAQGRGRSRVGGPSVLLIAAVLVAAAPMLMPGLPLGADTATHLYTLVHVEDLLRHGVLFSRWLPWQNGGLGNPRFLFYPWVPYYAVEPLVLLGLSHALALCAAFVAALALAALGGFAWCRQWCDERAAAVGAVAYVLSPYLLFATYARASFAEVVALGVAPWALWGAMRWAARPSAGRLAASAALAALTVLCHPITGGLLLPAWVALHLVGARWSGPRVAASLMALALALCASAVLWLPARAEREEISDVHTFAPGLDYRHNFLHPGQLVAWRAAWHLEPGLGVAALLLAVVAVVAGRRREQRGPDPRRLLALGVAILALLVLPASRILWLAGRDIARDVQFPHRLLGPASLLLAGLAATGVAALRDRSSRHGAPRPGAVAVAVFVVLLAAPALPLRHTHRVRTVPPLDVNFVAARDREAGLRGFGYNGEFMPRQTGSLWAAWHAAAEPAQRLVHTSVPPDGRILAGRYAPLRYEAVVGSPRAWRAVFAALAFPGWTVIVDGQPARTGWTAEGLLTADVPAGRHEVVAAFGTTPPRRLGRWISLAAILCLIALPLAGRLRFPRTVR